MSWDVRTFAAESYAAASAAVIGSALPAEGRVVITGGGTAEQVYGELATAGAGWSGIDVFFSDERCVPPDHPASNFGMAQRTLLGSVRPRSVHRMEGERPPAEAARSYDGRVRAVDGFDLVLLGLGDDAHVAGLFPGSPALTSSARCVDVERPDGMRGVTLTPPALLSARSVVFVVTGASKAAAVAR
ncbi:MAG: 6-phosphogluconolactonase, partial [Actinomycetota bacterium]|nr:6-phosphogluconolactonase [Actinomycetota bacterium]